MPTAPPRPSTDSPARAPHRIELYLRWLQRHRALEFEDYEALWRWSTSDLKGFWSSLWEWFDIESASAYETVLVEPVMPGARWFPGAQVNYARQALRHAEAAHAAGHPAVVFQNERLAEPVELSWPELARQVRSFAAHLENAGVVPGDRVAAYLPNTPHTVVAFLACASVGAIWSVCSPDMGPLAVLDRFRQIAPKVLLAVDGQLWGGIEHDRRGVLREILANLPSVEHLVLLGYANPEADPGEFATTHRAAHAFADWTAALDGPEPAWLPFDHPLWIVYSSGTTGLPKAMVHGHGGVMLEGLKGGVIHLDLAPSIENGERFFWFSSTGWIMWNAQVAGLLGGTTVCLYDGNPAGPRGSADWSCLWRFAARARASFFGAGAAFFASCLKAGVEPQREADLSRLRAIGSTGSPLSEDGYRWIWQHAPKVAGRDIWIVPICGGTDFAGAFLSGLPTLPVHAGEMQCRSLGAAVHAWSEPDVHGTGRELIDTVGELVCTEPLPSMPLYFWGDEGQQRYRESYFEMYRQPDGRGVWRHGDWLRLVPRPGAVGGVVYGRSDATINRHGVRMGTAELYRAVEALPEVLDSLVIDLEYLGRDSWMPLFVVLREGLVLDDALRRRIADAVRAALSPRHVPSEILQVDAIPRTLSGKKMELPVKKLLMGAPAHSVFKLDAMANAQSVEWFAALARQRLGLR